jgi:hypothetical protein
MSATRPPSTSAGRWSPAEITALLQALEPLGGPAVPACSVSVHDRRIDLAPDPSAGTPRHRALVQVGRLVGAVENTLRALGWAPRTVIAGTPDARPLAVVAGTGRRPATPTDLARRRIDRCRGNGGSPRYAAPADQARVVDVAHAAGSRGAWLHLLNGPTRDGKPAWHGPGSVPADTLTLDLPWRRDPVLAVCTHTDTLRETVVAGVVVESATVEAALRGLRADVYVDAFDDESVRGAVLLADPHETGVGHAVLRLRP